MQIERSWSKIGWHVSYLFSFEIAGKSCFQKQNCFTYWQTRHRRWWSSWVKPRHDISSKQNSFAHPRILKVTIRLEISIKLEYGRIRNCLADSSPKLHWISDRFLVGQAMYFYRSTSTSWRSLKIFSFIGFVLHKIEVKQTAFIKFILVSHPNFNVYHRSKLYWRTYLLPNVFPLLSKVKIPECKSHKIAKVVRNIFETGRPYWIFFYLIILHHRNLGYRPIMLKFFYIFDSFCWDVFNK